MVDRGVLRGSASPAVKSDPGAVKRRCREGGRPTAGAYRSQLRPSWQDEAMTSAHLHLTFPAHLVSQPVIHRLGTEFGLVTNIRRANIEERGGWIIVEVQGDDERVAEAIAWLAEQGLQVDRIEA